MTIHDNNQYITAMFTLLYNNNDKYIYILNMIKCKHCRLVLGGLVLKYPTLLGCCNFV